VPFAAVREVLKGDYAESLKRKVFLASRGLESGRRACLLCGKEGHATRVSIPDEALRVDQPDLAGVRLYCLCLEHNTLDPEDELIVQALAARRSAKP